MSADSSEKIFEIESLELLEFMEQALLELEKDTATAPDEQINSIFRAAHTIKGSAGIFGYTKVVEFTHLVESVLDFVRIGRLPISSELLSLLLICRDIIKQLVLNALKGTNSTDSGFDKYYQEASTKLQVYIQEDETAAQVKETLKEDAETAISKNDIEETLKNPTTSWRLTVSFGHDVIRNGMDPLSFVHYLSSIGTIKKVITNWDRLPEIDEIDPESCYLNYVIEIETQANQQTLESAFEFILDDCELEISRISSEIDTHTSINSSDENLQPFIQTNSATHTREVSEPITPPLNQQSFPITEQETSPPSKPSNSKKELTNKVQHSQDETIRVSAAKLGDLINLVGELVISSANMNLLGERSKDSELIVSMENMARLVENIRDKGLGLRMVPIGDIFNRYIRIVRDMSSSLQKDINLEIVGSEQELDKTIVEKIRDPLMHLVRNAIDHGIESPNQRQRMNKPPQATLRLNAYHDSGSIVIEIEDDGAGLNTEKIFAKAVTMGLVTEDQEISDDEIYRFIFAPGFSTVAEVTDISGRGVGMDVVLKNIAELRGTIDVESWTGKGTRFSIRLPLTLAIIDGFLVRVGECSYVIPLDMVDECIEHSIDENNPSNDNYVNLRGKVLSYIHLGALFNESYNQKKRQNIVIVKSGRQKIGLVVDELLGEYQTVIKPLGKVFMNLNGISGATIIGNGEVAPIIDVPSLVERAKRITPRQINKALNTKQQTAGIIETVMH